MQRTDDGLAEAACGYWERRGLPTLPAQTVPAPGVPLLLLALLAVTTRSGPAGGGVVVPRPGAPWYAEQARLLGRSVHPVPVPAECGGVPDPFALQEAVRRAREEGADPRVLVVSVADDPTGTVVSPELLHETCEMAVGEGLLIVSDETWRDTLHDPHAAVVVSPAEMLGTPPAVPVVVLARPGAAPVPGGEHAGVARFPGTGPGLRLADAVQEVLRTLHAPLSAAAAEAALRGLAESDTERGERASLARVQGALAGALHEAVREAGASARLPQAGAHLYADLEPSRAALAARGIREAAVLEAELVRRLGPHVRGGHSFGDDPHDLRVRLSTRLLTAGLPHGGARTAEQLLAGAAHVRGVPAVARALETVRGVLADLAGPRL